ncbi:response regulator [Nostoc sp. FACHB-110]|uniref:response regulator n=1 Tax=Nostoc sp. FACHB-110 TaxID=2692834 RepID=UPI00168335CC|nr:response regulator [Nostoc sp. FACHB-110]MBD2435656.1 response regulator [Nostoc sp. FACHB-110]
MNECSNHLFAGDGEMAVLVRSHNWSQTPLGKISTWSSSLRTAVSICLNSRFPMVIWWGKELVLIYNDAWRAILGTKHPNALGKSGWEVWPEVWNIIGEQLNNVLETGQATWFNDLLLPAMRYGYLQEEYFTYSYSPIFLENGQVGGVFTAVTETTKRVIGERQLRTLRELAANTLAAKSVEKACQIAWATLANNPYDIPLALLYLVENDGRQARLVETIGIAAGTLASPQYVNLTQTADNWQLAQVKNTGEAAYIDDLKTRFGELSGGVWEESPRAAIVLPITQSGQKQQLSGLLILGVSPRRQFDDDYRGFFDLVANHVATAIANAYAYEQERQRAEALASLVQELVHLHGGSVTASSVEGEGSCFTVSVPSDWHHLPQERISHTPVISQTVSVNSYIEKSWRCLPEEGNREQNPTPSCGHILLADDNADMRNYVQRLLQEKYAVEAVADGLAALERIRQNPPDLLLTDVMMPGMDGLELLRSLRADPQTREIPIILLSARSGEESRIEGLAGGADDYLIKPFSARELLARVEATLKMTKLRRDAAKREQELQIVSEAAQRQAQTATANLEKLLATIQDQFFILDREWHFVYVSDRFVEMVNTPRECLLGKIIWDVFPDTVGGEFDIQAHRALAEQIFVEFEYFYPPWQRWFENRIYPSQEGLSILVTDITKRKLAETAIHKSEAIARARAEELETLMQITPVALWIAHDPNCHYITANKTAYELMEAEPGELATATPEDGSYSLKFKQLRNGKEIAPYDLPMQKSARTGQPVTDELQFVFEDGTVKFIYGSSVPLRNEDGEIRGVVAAFVDITERKHTEEALKESELNFRTLADTMPQLFWTTRGDGYHEYFNRRWYEYTGMTLHDTQGWGWSNLLHPDDRQRCLTVWNESLRTGKDYNIEYRFRRASDGQYRWFLGQAFPLRDQNGQIIRWFGSCTDIHDQRCALEERDLALERERAAREEAEVANRIKDEFLAVLSHELRSPLNPILGWTKLLLTRKFDEQATKNALRTIERNAKLQTQLIEDLLDVSRILRGKMVLNVCPVDLTTVITAAIETVRLAAEAKKIQIQTVITSQLGLVNGDSARLQQVLWNLLSNAVKFTPDGGQITIQLRQFATKAEIQVQDTGKGINPEFLPYVFEYFRQQDGSTTRKFGGLGLGLAIVRHLVELHGGTVKATSLGEDKGATFTVTLPLIATVPKVEEVITPVVIAGDLSNLKILVVDDDEDIRELLLTILEQYGATAKIVASAQEVLANLDKFQPDVLISDIGMPDIDGYMLIRQIKSQKPETFRKLRTIALTAYAGELDQRQALAAGFQRHITKPVDPEELVVAIATLVKSAEC